jgi:hypothetical protein
VTAVYGCEPGLVFDLAHQLGWNDSNGTQFKATDVLVDFRRQGVPAFDPQNSERFILPAGDPFLSGNRLLAEAVTVLTELRDQSTLVRRVLIGDFRSIRTFWNPDEVRRAIGVLIAILRRAGIPAILFETTAEPSAGARQAIIGKLGGPMGTFAGQPAIVDAADVLIEVVMGNQGTMKIATDVRGGQPYSWPDPHPAKRG